MKLKSDVINIIKKENEENIIKEVRASIRQNPYSNFTYKLI